MNTKKIKIDSKVLAAVVVAATAATAAALVFNNVADVSKGPVANTAEGPVNDVKIETFEQRLAVAEWRLYSDFEGIDSKLEAIQEDQAFDESALERARNNLNLKFK